MEPVQEGHAAAAPGSAPKAQRDRKRTLSDDDSSSSSDESGDERAPSAHDPARSNSGASAAAASSESSKHEAKKRKKEKDKKGKSKKDKKDKKDKKEKKDKKSKHKKKHKKGKEEIRSAIDGHIIKRKITKTSGDKERDLNRKSLLQFLNSSYDD